MFFISKKHHLSDHDSPRVQPQIHHQKTTLNTRLFQKPHQKTPVKPENRFDGRL